MVKGQINIDLIFGYLAFILFVWYFSGYMGDLFTPFLDYAKVEALEKKTLLNRNEVASFINVNNIQDVCNLTLEGKYGNEVAYSIRGFNLFKKDYSFFSPDNTAGGLVFVRDYSSFTILAGTNSTDFNSTIQFTIPSTLVRVDGVNNSVFDFYNQSIDDYGNIVFTVGLHASSSDSLVGYSFHTGFKDDAFLMVEIFNNDYSNLWIGEVHAYDSCSSGSENDMLTFHNFFKRIGYGSDEFYALISISTWWENA
ncbi:MAG: hypothetical protein GON13_02885 [Nanoarchaeota archaeon]|nr:hypothetical protein [Nanoarchaeota archaeon]